MPVRTGLPQDVVDRIAKSVPAEHLAAALDGHIASLPRARRHSIPTSRLIHLYTVEHLTLREIATLVGMLPQTVYKRLRSAGITSRDGEWVKRECGFCGKKINVRRAQARQMKVSYCDSKCYGASLANPNFLHWRHGTRLARLIIGQHTHIPEGAVVHHKDGNERNNDLANLQLFASQSDHKKHHHGKSKVAPIWDGAELP